jgi:hypothetical protein
MDYMHIEVFCIMINDTKSIQYSTVQHFIFSFFPRTLKNILYMSILIFICDNTYKLHMSKKFTLTVRKLQNMYYAYWLNIIHTSL